LIDVDAASVSYMDFLMVCGGYQMRPALPYVPGTDAAGVIVPLKRFGCICTIESGPRFIFLRRLVGQIDHRPSLGHSAPTRQGFDRTFAKSQPTAGVSAVRTGGWIARALD
jgi:hypothetical protein